MQHNQTGNKMQRNFLLYCEQSVLYYKGPVCSLETIKHYGTQTQSILVINYSQVSSCTGYFLI